MTSYCEQVLLRQQVAARMRVRNSHSERFDWRGRGRRCGRAGTRRAGAAALAGDGQT